MIDAIKQVINPLDSTAVIMNAISILLLVLFIRFFVWSLNIHNIYDNGDEPTKDERNMFRYKFNKWDRMLELALYLMFMILTIVESA